MATEDLGPLPRTLLQNVLWTFRGAAYPGRATFEAAVAERQSQKTAERWRPAEVVLRVPRVRIRPDVRRSRGAGGHVAELAADDGQAFTAGELLFKVHNAFVADLRELDHRFFEGFTRAADPAPGEPPLYVLDLGS